MGRGVQPWGKRVSGAGEGFRRGGGGLALRHHPVCPHRALSLYHLGFSSGRHSSYTPAAFEPIPQPPHCTIRIIAGLESVISTRKHKAVT